MCSHGLRARSVHRGTLAESRQPLQVAPDRTGIRFMLLGQPVRLHGLLARQIESLHDRIEHRVARR
jgi:hypothetical protein